MVYARRVLHGKIVAAPVSLRFQPALSRIIFDRLSAIRLEKGEINRRIVDLSAS